MSEIPQRIVSTETRVYSGDIDTGLRQVTGEEAVAAIEKAIAPKKTSAEPEEDWDRIVSELHSE